MNRKLVVFLLVFTAMNMAFVPLLSLYGLRVCPVLSLPELGFGFGCYYTAAFILFSNLINLSFIFLTLKKSKPLLPDFFYRKKNRTWIYVGAYIVATVLSIGILQYMLKLNHLSTESRAPEILALASLLLGITQVYGLNWALEDSVKDEQVQTVSIRKRWLQHMVRTMLPIAVVVVILLHFLISQAEGFNEGKIAPIAPHDMFIEQISFLIIFLLGWLLITFIFHFLSEKAHVGRVQTYLDHLRNLDFGFQSSSNTAWGLWAAIIDQLNELGKILGERTRLLKSFSRFVTADVAEKALQQELKETTGTTRELTVIMSDIRNFTGISENLSPNEVVTLLNEYFGAMLDVMTKNRVNVDKFIGDGILAYVDSETEGSESGDIVQNRLGVEAALAMIEGLEKLNIKLKEMNLPEVRIGIGIFRGPLVVGLIGTEAKLQHTIVGDTVNRTARLESLCKELGVSIVISGLVWHSLEEKVQQKFKSFGKQTVKGIAVPMEVFGGPV